MCPTGRARPLTAGAIFSPVDIPAPREQPRGTRVSGGRVRPAARSSETREGDRSLGNANVSRFSAGWSAESKVSHRGSADKRLTACWGRGATVKRPFQTVGMTFFHITVSHRWMWNPPACGLIWGSCLQNGKSGIHPSGGWCRY